MVFRRWCRRQLANCRSLVNCWGLLLRHQCEQADSMLGAIQLLPLAIRVGYERKLNGWDNDKQHAVYDNAIGFNIELRGLSSNYGLGTQEMLRSNILPYQKHFVIC